MENKINFTIPDEVATQASDGITAVLQLLQPYLLALTPQERQKLPKMSDGTEPFVGKIIDYSNSNSQFAPPYMDVEALASDLQFREQGIPLFRLAKQLHDGLEDALMQAGAEAFVMALSYYNSVKQAAKMDIPGAKAIYEDLKQRFER